MRSRDQRPVGGSSYGRAMQLAAVFAVLDRLDKDQVRYWVGGGWGVDALVRKVTRPHRDLDLAVNADQLADCLAALEALGYEVETDWLPIRVELSSARGWVDIHPVNFDAAGNGVQAGPDGTTFDYPAEALQLGVLEGCRLPCLSIEQQIAFRAGYDLRPEDWHDLKLLRSLDS